MLACLLDENFELYFAGRPLAELQEPAKADNLLQNLWAYLVGSEILTLVTAPHRPQRETGSAGIGTLGFTFLRRLEGFFSLHLQLSGHPRDARRGRLFRVSSLAGV